MTFTKTTEKSDIGSVKEKVKSNFKGILTSIFLTVILFSGMKAFAADNVLQAVEMDGRNDSYNIILRSDDKADVQKTIQAPNKMILTLNGIRASKTINTIYNNTANVDSVVVEPTGDDSVRIFIQADNVENAVVNFDTLKTPLASQPESAPKKNNIVLSDPVSTYQPVYNPATADAEDEHSGFAMALYSVVAKAKNFATQNKATALMAFGMIMMFIVLCIRTIKGNDNDIKVGLSQSLKARELQDYREGMALNGLNQINTNVAPQSAVQQQPLNLNALQNKASIPSANVGYGLKAYGATPRSPYTTSEFAPKRPSQNNNSNLALQQIAKELSKKKPLQQQVNRNLTSPVAGPSIPRRATKTSNIDSMKFLESMTKIYEKNGRSDLAQGLKNNMKKVKVNLG